LDQSQNQQKGDNLQDGTSADFKDFRFLGTLDCSAIVSPEVAMAVYDPTIDDWNCTSTGNLPNDTSVPSDVVTGLPEECLEDGFVAVWNHTINAWGCSALQPLLFQAIGNLQPTCRSGDVLTLNVDDPQAIRPAGLCDDPQGRQVGPNAVVSLDTKRRRNLGDPDESFYVQTTSKAIGGLDSAGGNEHFNWQYWAWSPIRSSFASSMGTYPPVFPFEGLHLAAVSVATFNYNNVTFTSVNIAMKIQPVLVVPTITNGSYPSIYNMAYVPTAFGPQLSITTSPASFLNDNTNATLSSLTIPMGHSVSITITTFPSGMLGLAKSVWMSVSLWFSQIVAET